MTLLAGLAGIALLLWFLLVGILTRDRHREDIVSDPVGCLVNIFVLLLLIGIIWRSLR